MTNESAVCVCGGASLSCPWPQLRKLCHQSPGFSSGVILRAKGIKFRANGLGAEKLYYRRHAAAAPCGAPAAQGHRAELDRGWGWGLADPSDPSTAGRRSGRG